jgi:DNA invertase Pin-like site-specific DNA recombinase
VSEVERAALYLRVSSEDQNLAGQERELRVECSRRGWEVATVYAEKVSGTGRVQRREYERLLAEARAPERPWTRLMVWSLDRWSREERFSRAVSAIEELESVGIHFHSLREPMLDSPEDGTPNMGRDLLRAILPVISAFESRRRSERVRVALAEIKAGRREARGKLGPAFKVDLTAIRKAEALRERGEPWAVIAHRLGIKAGTLRSAVFKAKHGLRAFPEALVPGVRVHPEEPGVGP